MPTSEERRLKLVKGTPQAAGGSTPARPSARRTVTRRIPRQEDPVAAILERLDQEPVNADDTDETPAGKAPSTDDSDRTPARKAPSTDDTDQTPAGTGPAVGSADGDGTDGNKADREKADRNRAYGHDAADEDAVPPAARTRRRLRYAGQAPGRRQVTMALLAAALCAALAAAGVFGRYWYQDRELNQAHQQALAAAKQTTVNFVSVSAASVDSDLQRIVAASTGDFKDQFLRGQSQVRTAVVENKVESRGSVLRAGLVSGDLHTAVVLVAIDATVKNVHKPDGYPSHYRIQVDVTRDAQSGTWLVSRLQFVG
jgi:Mce-associated membrane protein